MIQRIQTIWLLLAATAGALTYVSPFYVGNAIENGIETARQLNGASNLFLLLVTGLSILLSVVAIFYFKKRSLQRIFCLLGMLVALGIIALYYLEITYFVSGSLALTSVFPAAIVLFNILAWRGITKDVKLLKSANSLR